MKKYFIRSKETVNYFKEYILLEVRKNSENNKNRSQN